MNGLHPHHVIYRSAAGGHALSNLLTLCSECHRAEHGGFLEVVVIEILEKDLRVRFVRLKGWKP